MGPLERVQSHLRRGRDPEDAEDHDKATPGRRAVSAAEGDQVVRQHETVHGEQAARGLVVVVRVMSVPFLRNTRTERLDSLRASVKLETSKGSECGRDERGARRFRAKRTRARAHG